MGDDNAVYLVTEHYRSTDESRTVGVFTRSGLANEFAERRAVATDSDTTVSVEKWPALSSLPDHSNGLEFEWCRDVVGPTVLDAKLAPKELDS